MKTKVYCLFVPILFLAIFASSKPACAQERSIGVPQFSTTENNFDDNNSAVSFILRSAVAQPLVSMRDDRSLALRTASEFSIPNESGQVFFTLLRDTRFTNNTRIAEHDIAFSLKRCFSRYEISIGAESRSTSSTRYKLSVPTDITNQVLLSNIASCPILHRVSTEAFGNSFGRGTNIVGAGPYEMRDIRRGRHLVLQLDRAPTSAELPPRKVHILSTEGDRHSLDLLRNGSLDMIFLEKQDVIEDVLKDETLSVRKCSIYNVVLRKGLSLSCDHSIDLVHLNYDYELSSYRKLVPEASPST